MASNIAFSFYMLLFVFSILSFTEVESASLSRRDIVRSADTSSDSTQFIKRIRRSSDAEATDRLFSARDRKAVSAIIAKIANSSKRGNSAFDLCIANYQLRHGYHNMLNAFQHCMRRFY